MTKTNVIDMNAEIDTKLAFENGRNAFFNDMAELGSLERLGKQSPFKAAMRFQQAIRDKFAFATTEDARDAYQRYAGTETGNVVGVDKVSQSLATATANLLTFGAPASVHAGEALYAQIDAVIAGYAAKDLSGSKIRCYEKANRELHKLYQEKYQACAGDNDAALAATMKACDDAALASWLIKEGATKIGDGSAGDGDGAEAKVEKAKATPLEKLDLARKAIAKLVAEDLAGNATLAKLSKALDAEYHALALAKAKAA